MSQLFQPEAITTEHVLEALKRIDEGLEVPKPSTYFDIVYEGKRYPPKSVMRIAHRLATGNDIWKLNGGNPTNSVVEELGFDIMTKGSDYSRMKNFWKIAPGEQAILWDDFYNNGIMAVSYSENEVGDLRKYSSYRDLEKALGKENSNEGRSLWICYQAQKGDVVFANKGRNTVVGIGVIDGDYEYDGTRDFPHKRKVKWLSNKEWAYSTGQFSTEKRKRPSLFRADTLAKTKLAPQILKEYLEKYPEYTDIFIENGVWPVFDDGSYGPLIEKAAAFGNPLLLRNFFLFLGRVFEKAGIKISDERAFFSTPKNENAISFAYDQRYILRLQRKKSINTVFFIHKRDDKYDFSPESVVESGQFANISPLMDYVIVRIGDGSELTEDVLNKLVDALKENMKSGKIFYFRHIHKNSLNQHIYDVATDPLALDQLISDLSEELDGGKSSAKKEVDNGPPQQITTMNLNTIFYGPPGTGKTYNTVVRAVEIIENRKMKSYDEALQIFNANLHKQIEFITFHQNFSYEDFIQGLRPDTENEKELTFERRDGVFKVIADRALKNIYDSEQTPTSKRGFDETFNNYIRPLIEGEVEELEVKMKRLSYFITAVTNKSIEFRKPSGGTAHTLSISTLRKMYDSESLMNIQGLSSYYSPLLDSLLKLAKDPSRKAEKVNKKNYVLIIDEINRANISRVFGELITLIEPNKRSHGKTPMQAQLPSGDIFIVPSNLYIIGTMNTADKSIALLDIALRRRFEFEAMYPLYEIEGFDIYDKDIFKKINEQIITLKGHDFQIGHEYFMNENKDLVRRMNNKVIPLLMEYFLNDKEEVKKILLNAGLLIEENSWPIKITSKRD